MTFSRPLAKLQAFFSEHMDTINLVVGTVLTLIVATRFKTHLSHHR